MAKANDVVSEVGHFRNALKELTGDIKYLLSGDQNGIIFLERILNRVIEIQKAMEPLQKVLEEFKSILEKQIEKQRGTKKTR